jgi:phosphoribosyl 1,2-cyclic phosphodiesterase
VKVAKAANVKKLVIFHHDPLHNDEFLDKVGEEVAQRFPNSLMAREGLSLQLLPPHKDLSEASVQAPKVPV